MATLLLIILWIIPFIAFLVMAPSVVIGVVLSAIKLLFDFVLLGLINSNSNKEHKTEAIKKYFLDYSIMSAILAVFLCFSKINNYGAFTFLELVEKILSIVVVCVIAPFAIVYMASKKSLSITGLFRDLSEKSRKSSNYYIEDEELNTLVKDINALRINPAPVLETKWFTDTTFFKKFDKIISYDAEGNILYNKWNPNQKPDEIISRFSQVVSYSVKDNKDATLNKLNDIKLSMAEITNAINVNYNNYNKIKTGMQGELRVQNVINTTKDPNWILINSANLPIVNTDQTFENDAILITDRGVFAIEIKNYENAEFEISTEKKFYIVRGKTRTLWEEKSDRDNPIVQVEKHEDYLIKLLSDAFKRDMSKYVFPIIILSNDQSSVINYSGFPIIYANQVAEHIKGFPIAFSNPQPMNQIADFIKANLKKEKHFPFELYNIDGFQPEVISILNRCKAFLVKYNLIKPDL